MSTIWEAIAISRYRNLILSVSVIVVTIIFIIVVLAWLNWSEKREEYKSKNPR